MAALPSSDRTTLPGATSFSATLLFSSAGQLMETSKRRPGSSKRSVVNSTPLLLRLMVTPAPSSSVLLRFRILKRTSRSSGKRSALRRSSLSFSKLIFARASMLSVMPASVSGSSVNGNRSVG